MSCLWIHYILRAYLALAFDSLIVLPRAYVYVVGIVSFSSCSRCLAFDPFLHSLLCYLLYRKQIFFFPFTHFDDNNGCDGWNGLVPVVRNKSIL